MLKIIRVITAFILVLILGFVIYKFNVFRFIETREYTTNFSQFVSLRGVDEYVVNELRTNENFHRDQVGGTAVMGVGRICDLISNKGYDPTGLGRWSWIKLGKDSVTTYIISAYLPRKPNKHSKGRTVWDQHTRYFQKQRGACFRP